MIAQLTGPFGRLVCTGLTVFWLILLARVIVSFIVLAGWRPPTTGPWRSAIDLLEDVTEPVLKPIRRLVPPTGMLDVSILVAFVVIIVLQLALC
jgi:YGGT family.